MYYNDYGQSIIYLSWAVGLINISLTFTWFGDFIAYKIAFAISSDCNVSILFEACINFAMDSSVIVSKSSVDTAPGSIQVTRMLYLGLNSFLNPSLNAVMACFVAQ